MLERLAYLILGSRGAGRGAVVTDLVDFGLDAETSAQVFVSEGDASAWSEALPLRHDNAEAKVYDWRGLDDGMALDATGEVVLVVADGRSDPADSVEAFFNWLRSSEYALGRVVTVVDCSLVQATPPLLQWYECCIHFTDVVLLGNRTDVSNKWVDEFKDRYIKECYPCHFVLIKKGKVSNPKFVLEPEARRISKLFDENDLLDLNLDDDVEFGGDEPEPEDDEDEEEFEGGDPDKDPFLTRLASGQRGKTIPNIAKWVD